jgi:hypothetical protein
MDMDWGKESQRSGTLYPEGTYRVRIDKIEKVQASTGTWQYRWKARILEPISLEGKQITEHTALTEKSLWKIAWLVSACGVVVDTLPKMNVDSAAFNNVVRTCEGRTVYWHAKIGLNNKGEERNEIDDYKKDESQEPVEFSLVESNDIPEFLKE